MYPLDHIMIEVPDPLAEATMVSERLGLPFAWPLIETEAYSSVGVNFGSVNFEFIDFRSRFGIPGKSYSGLSGLAFRLDDSEEDAIKRLTELGLDHRIGESTEAHTTITIEEAQLYPTLFLVKYHFDTSGWHTRLRQAFEDCRGGRFHLDQCRSFVINHTLPTPLASELATIEVGNRGGPCQIFFDSRDTSAHPVIISDLIPGLEIIING